MAQQFTIECRNKTASIREPDKSNGDWTTRLQEQILLEEGDSLICRNAFVDTKAVSGQKIIVQEDTTLTLEFVQYNTVPFNSSAVTNDTPHYTPVDIPTGNFYGDDRTYIRCEKTENDGNPLYSISELHYSPVETFLEGNGGFGVIVEYNDANNIPAQKGIHLEQRKIWSQGGYEPINILSRTPPDQVKIYHAYAGKLGVQLWPYPEPSTGPNGQFAGPNYKNTFIDEVRGQRVGEDGAVFSPRIFKQSIVVPAGAYEPPDITERINRELSGISGSITASNLTGANNFLDEVSGDDYFIDATDGSTAQINGFQFDVGHNVPMTGASQVELDYDIAQNRFNWNYLHLPIYQSSNQAVGIISQPQDGAGPFVYGVTRFSGIMFLKLEAETATKPVDDFWTSKLGFKDFNTLNTYQFKVVASNPQHDFVLKSNGEKASFPISQHPPVVGKEMTGGFQGIDTVTQKETDNYFKAPELEAGSAVFASTNATDPIPASVSVISDDTDVAFGYFLVSVKAQFANNFLTPEQNNSSIVSIVSRYYSKDSYTAGSSADSIVYVHKGSPQLLSAFDCRILDSDGNLADNIGGDNTIFLQVVKVPKQLPESK